MITRIQRAALVLVSLAAAAAAGRAQPAAGPDAEQERPPRYRVEVILFEHRDLDPDEELLAYPPGAAAPATLREPVAMRPYILDERFRPPEAREGFLEPGADTATPPGEGTAGPQGGDGAPDDAAALEALEALEDEAAAAEAPRDELELRRVPRVNGTGITEFRFRRLEPDELELGDEYARLERIDAYEPLLHVGWVQEALPLAEANPLTLAHLGVANPSGMLRLHLGRFLHLNVDLVYRTDRPLQWLPARPAPPPPEAPAESAAPAERDAPGAPPGSGPGSGRSRFGEPAFGQPRFGRARAIELAPIELTPRVRLQTQRRARSGELHYVDHPVLGLLFLITPVPEAPAEPEEEGDGLTPAA